MIIPVISIVSKSGSGKTTLLEKVLRELKQRGLKVAVVKHDVHGFDIDKPGKDTWRHAQAGADIVAISSPQKFAMIEKRDEELSLDDVLSRIKGVDLVLTEGYKRGNKPKIEVFRSGVHDSLLCAPEELLAIVSDITWDIQVPYYHIDDVIGVTNEIQKYIEKLKER